MPLWDSSVRDVANHNGHFHFRDCCGDLLGDVADSLRVNAQLPAAENLSGELQEDPASTFLWLHYSVDGFHDAFRLGV